MRSTALLPALFIFAALGAEDDSVNISLSPSVSSASPAGPADNAGRTQADAAAAAGLQVLTDADTAVHADCTLWTMGGGITGCGILAHYNAPGPQTITVTRDTTPAKNGDLPPITIITVVDPQGHTVAVSDITDQDAQSRIKLAIPKGIAGIWRFSVEGGHAKDHITFELPGTPSWGIRGEMALGCAPDETGREGWLWVPTGTTDCIIEALGGGEVHLADAAGTDLPGTPEPGRPAGKRTL